MFPAERIGEWEPYKVRREKKPKKPAPEGEAARGRVGQGVRMASISPVIIQVSVARDEWRSVAIWPSDTVTIVINDPKAVTASRITTRSWRW